MRAARGETGKPLREAENAAFQWWGVDRWARWIWSAGGLTPLSTTWLDASLFRGGPSSRPVESGVKPPHSKSAGPAVHALPLIAEGAAKGRRA